MAEPAVEPTLTPEQNAARAAAEADIALMQVGLQSKKQTTRNKHWWLIALAAIGVIGLLMLWLAPPNSSARQIGMVLVNLPLGLVSFWLFARLMSLRSH